MLSGAGIGGSHEAAALILDSAGADANYHDEDYMRKKNQMKSTLSNIQVFLTYL
jgi:hypothetical protein